LYEESGGVYNQIDFNTHTHSTSNLYYRKDYAYRICLDAKDNVYPMKIGTSDNPKLKVKWDGTLEAAGAKFGDGFVQGGTFLGGCIGLGVNGDLKDQITTEKTL
jgi:hypothetical protein